MAYTIIRFPDTYQGELIRNALARATQNYWRENFPDREIRSAVDLDRPDKEVNAEAKGKSFIVNTDLGRVGLYADQPSRVRTGTTSVGMNLVEDTIPGQDVMDMLSVILLGKRLNQIEVPPEEKRKPPKEYQPIYILERRGEFATDGSSVAFGCMRFYMEDAIKVLNAIDATQGTREYVRLGTKAQGDFIVAADGLRTYAGRINRKEVELVLNRMKELQRDSMVLNSGVIPDGA